MKTPVDDTNLLLAFGNVIRERRKEMGLSQEEFAHRAKLHRTYISDIERGMRNVALANIWRIAAALDMPTDELMRRVTQQLSQ